MDELWHDEFEIMHWVAERFERSGHSIEVGEALRVFPEEQYDSVREMLRRLSAHTYLVAVNSGGLGRDPGARSPVVQDITERALRGLWSDNAEILADRILAVLAEGAENEPDLEKRSRFKAGLKGFGGMTRNVLVDVVAAAIARSNGTTEAGYAPDTITQDHSWPRNQA